VDGVFVLLVSLVPVLFIGALLAELLLANAPRRGKRPDVHETEVPVVAAMAASRQQHPRMRRFPRLSPQSLWLATFNAVVLLGWIIRVACPAQAPTWTIISVYALVAPTVLVLAQRLLRRGLPQA
jgi:hypothetical protein